MISHIGKITVYVESQPVARQFWVDKVGFHVTAEQQAGSILWLEVAPPGEQKTSLVLYDKATMIAANPEAIAHPAIIFEAIEIENFWNHLRANGVEVGELQLFSHGKMFNFKDPDGNEYMVRE